MKMKSKVKVERLKSTLSIQTSSHKEKKMIKYIKAFVSKNIPDASIVVKNKNIYVTKGTLSSGEYYPCVIAHTDTVHDILKDFSVFRQGDLLFAFSEDTGEQAGIGGDDKSGVWIALEMLLKKDVIKGSFFWGEEIGCMGSGQADVKFFDDVGYCLQCDRRGNTDFITSIYSDVMVSEKFRKVIKPVIRRHGYKEEDGATTDVHELKGKVDVSMVNMSCGYYSPHTDTEVVSITDSLDCLEMVDELIEALGLVRYEHQMVSAYSNYGWGYNARTYNTGYGTAVYPIEKQKGVIDMHHSYEEACFDCQGDLEVVNIGELITMTLCPYCHVDWRSYNEIDVYSNSGREVQRLAQGVPVFNRGAEDVKSEDYYYCAEEEKLFKWDEVVVYTDEEVVLLQQRHNFVDPNQVAIEYETGEGDA